MGVSPFYLSVPRKRSMAKPQNALPTRKMPMNIQSIADDIKMLMTPFLERGFVFEYFYEKGGDSSCTYVCRFKKGRDYFDWRETSGENEVHLMAFVNGVYLFPSVKTMFPKECRVFTVKHILKKATFQEKRKFVAELFKRELLLNKADFLGIPL